MRLNQVLRNEYVKDCEKGIGAWNKTLADEGVSERIYLPESVFIATLVNTRASFRYRGKVDNR
jgi:hypothetical protein